MSAADEFEELLEDLLEAGIFEPTEDGGLRPTESFKRRREERRAEVEGLGDDELAATKAEYATAGDVDPDDVGLRALGDAMAIDEQAESVDRERSLLAALAMGRIEASEEEPGVPEGFVSIEGEDIDGFAASHPAAVVYFWREDCDPCDGARDAFETLLADGEIPEWVGLGAVYGPDAAELIRENYQVSVAPTTLFFVDGEIDSRIVGNPGPPAFKSEIRMITEAAE